MTKFVAYDHNSIYAVGETRDAVIAKARDDARDDAAEFRTAPISDDLATWIDENGWNGHCDSFEIDRATGYIVDKTRRA